MARVKAIVASDLEADDPLKEQKVANRGKPAWIKRGWDPDKGDWDADSHVGKVLAALRAGTSAKNAALFGGIAPTTYHQWYSRGREHQPDAPFDRTEVPEEHLPYVDFAVAVEFSRARLEVELVSEIRKGWKDDPKFALQVAARLFPHWRETKGIEVGSFDQPSDGLGEALMADPAVAAAAAAYAEALADVGAFGSGDDD